MYYTIRYDSNLFRDKRRNRGTIEGRYLATRLLNKQNSRSNIPWLNIKWDIGVLLSIGNLTKTHNRAPI